MTHLDSGAGLTIRAMVGRDLDRVMAIAFSLTTAPQWTGEAYVAAMEGDAVPQRVALVAEAGGVVVGFVVAGVVGPEAEVESIAVAGEAQGRGIGAALLGGLIGELKSAGVKELRLEVRESNRTAVRLYERAGFREIGRRAGYYREPDEDAVVMGLGLRG